MFTHGRKLVTALRGQGNIIAWGGSFEILVEPWTGTPVGGHCKGSGSPVCQWTAWKKRWRQPRGLGVGSTADTSCGRNTWGGGCMRHETWHQIWASLQRLRHDKESEFPPSICTFLSKPQAAVDYWECGQSKLRWATSVKYTLDFKDFILGKKV